MLINKSKFIYQWRCEILIMKILIVEDDEDINKLLSEVVKEEGYKPKSAYSGTEAMIYLDEENWDLILLDLMLPGLSGESILNKIKEKSNIPIIVISAKDEQSMKIDMLRSGADDFIVKPFDIEEVSARIESVLRRYRNEFKADILKFRDIEVDLQAKSVKVNNENLSLTALEYLILVTLMEKPNKVFSKANIYESAWGEQFYGDDNIVNVHVSHLRSKLKKANPKEQYIDTIWGLGYKMKS